MRLTAEEVAAATGGTLVGPPVALDGAAIDSRGDVAGRLFVPIVASRDGHEFIADALARGAAAYLTSGRVEGGTAVVVTDTSEALTALGRHARSRVPDRVVAITGSVGKTTVKDLTASILRQRFVTGATARNLNNELGLPLTLLDAPGNVEAMVLEMGARGVGHIRALAEVGRPTIGVVTAVSAVHSEVFGGIDEVAIGKGELVESLPATGTAVLNGDDVRVRSMASRTSASVVLYGLVGADIMADKVTFDDELRPSFRLHTPSGSVDLAVAVSGEHQVANALAASAAALAAGASLGDVVAGLAVATLSPWRMELHRLGSGALVLNDAYNASPLSMAAALHSLVRLEARRHVAVLGTMAELGTMADEAHHEVGELARSLGIQVIAVAERRYGGSVVDDLDAALVALGPLDGGDAVLLKGSRVAGLERLAERLLGGAG